MEITLPTFDMLLSHHLKYELIIKKKFVVCTAFVLFFSRPKRINNMEQSSASGNAVTWDMCAGVRPDA